MKKIVVFTRAAEKSLLKIEQRYQKAILGIIDELTAWPQMPKNRDIVKLEGIEDTFRIRTGVYRVIIVEHGNSIIVTVLEIQKRKDAYK